jgi:hypothetical protein
MDSYLDKKNDKRLALSLMLLATGIAANSILGPFVSGVVTYPFSESVQNMTIGLDAVSLILVTPIGILAAITVYRGKQTGFIAALSLSTYALYTFVQMILGPQYIEFSPVVLLHLALFILSGFILVNAWQRIKGNELPHFNRRKKRISAIVLFLLAIFTSLSYIASIPQIIMGGTIPATYVEDPTVYWSIFLLDLGFVLPITIAVSVGLLKNRAFAQKAIFGMAGWYTLVVGSVAAMFVVMFLNGDANVDGVTVSLLLSAFLLIVLFSGWVWQPLIVHRKRWQKEQ